MTKIPLPPAALMLSSTIPSRQHAVRLRIARQLLPCPGPGECCVNTRPLRAWSSRAPRSPPTNVGNEGVNLLIPPRRLLMTFLQKASNAFQDRVFALPQRQHSVVGSLPVPFGIRLNCFDSPLVPTRLLKPIFPLCYQA